jgi:diguanylate cyclase (GGDEF)-like protein
LLEGRKYIAIALGVFGLHALAITLLHSPVAISDVLLDASVGLSCLVCYRRSMLSLGSTRWRWRLVAAALFCWCIGQTIITYDESLVPLQQSPTAIPADFYFFLFGIPLLLIVSSVSQRRRIPGIVWIDGLQASLAIYLVHLQIFPGRTGESHIDAISALRMTYAYNAENLTLVFGATLRLLAKPRREEARLYRVLCVFLWVYAPVAGWLNHLSVADNLPSGTYWDLLWAAPFVLLTILVEHLPRRAAESQSLPDQTWAGLLATNASPVFFTMGLLVMGVYVGREHFVFGTAAIAFALVSYGFRTSLLQTDSMRTERKLLESEAALVQANAQLEELSFVDRLTGVANRRRFEGVLNVEWNRARRLRLPLSLLVIDIDHFKLLNDRYGHLRGDACLINTARALSGCVRRSGELLARYGGEEFVAVLPGLDLAQAHVVAERMRQAIEALSLANEDAPLSRMTVSIGIASTKSAGVLEESDLFALADRALYEAKSQGRNRVAAGGPSAEAAELLPESDTLAPEN